MTKKTAPSAPSGRLPPNRLNAVQLHFCERILRGGMAKSLGLTITSISPRKLTGEMAVGPRHLNHNGRVNGGAIMAFADYMGAVGAAMHRPAGSRGGTLESKTNFFASGTGPVLRATCIPLHVGRRTSVWQTTITNADGRMVAMVTQTQMSLPAGAGPE
jgi:uncharacterized protein (TIGR00369 family)